MMSALGMELRKIKRRRFWLMAAGAAGLELAWVMAATSKRTGSAAEQRLLGLSLNSILSLHSLRFQQSILSLHSLRFQHMYPFPQT